MDDISALLQRQIAALAEQESSTDFLVSVEPFLRALESEPRIAIHLEDLRDETTDRVRVLEQVDNELVPKLVSLRKQLVVLRADLDDSDAQPLDAGGNEQDWMFSLAHFDVIAARDAQLLNYKGDDARTHRLLEILKEKRKALSQEPKGDCETWTVELHNLTQRWNHASRWLKLSMRVSAGLALIRLDRIPGALNPSPELREPGEDRQARRFAVLQKAFSVDQQFFFAVHADPLDNATRSLVEDQVSELRTGLSRLSVELDRRIGTTRSRRALIFRFKQRAEWHDAARLRHVAEDQSLGGGPEDRLTAELARFLFDQGLNPLTKPLIAGLQPDLLDPSVTPAFYVEAKQYKRADRTSLRKALWQVLDTVGRLQSNAYPITEAFCVVFRLDGPRYILPEIIPADGYRIYLTLIDVASSEISGRRQRYPPKPITVDEIFDLSPGDEDEQTSEDLNGALADDA